MAATNKENFMHVYDWGDDNSPYSRVGRFDSRLFRVKITGSGGSRTVAWDWLPSHREVPINPADYPADFDTSRLNHQHVFIWKAPVMEYGESVHVQRRQSNLLVIPFPNSYNGLGSGSVHSDGQNSVLMTRQPYNFSPGQKAGVVGNFTQWFVSWWAGGRASTILSETFEPARDNAFKRAFSAATSHLPTYTARGKVMSATVSAEAAAAGHNQARGLAKEVEQEYLRIARSNTGRTF
jgi:hypothetical protein